VEGKTAPKTLLIITLLILAGIGFLFLMPGLWTSLGAIHDYLSDREKVKSLIDSFGPGAPLVFIALQILQVILAPIPGEATGFIGGYLFGVLRGFIFSSIGLAVGSGLNFAIGRALGKKYIRRLIPTDTFERYDTLLRRQGIVALIVSFSFSPGSLKITSACFLGLSTLSIKVFLPIAALGRMPGTFMLSLQGGTPVRRQHPCAFCRAGDLWCGRSRRIPIPRAASIGGLRR
jgi:uncharacterized membrane protein YdjX (TVP38/TMEM64 family)